MTAATRPTTLTNTYFIDNVNATGWLVFAVVITVENGGAWQADVTGYDEGVGVGKDETLTFTSLDAVEQFGPDLADLVNDLVVELTAKLAA